MIRGMSTAKYAVESTSCEGSVPGAVGFVLDPWGLVRGQNKFGGGSDDPQSSSGRVRAGQSRKGITTAGLQLSQREVSI